MARHILIGGKQFDLDQRPLLMGILNVTPNSFSDGGDFFSTEAAVERALQMLEEGADIIDIGGESSRPGSREVSGMEEIRRVVPVIEALRAETSAPVSIDTRKAAVCQAAVKAGADILNDISGLKHDTGMLNVLRQHRLPVIIMHMKGTPENMQQNPVYDDLLAEVCGFLKQQAAAAVEAGSPLVIIDPGIGFGKTTAHNLSLLKHVPRLRELGYPVLLGPSRKRFIGNLLNLMVHERLEGTLAAAAIGVANGADVIRLHDVKAGRRVIDMAHHIRTAV